MRALAADIPFYTPVRSILHDGGDLGVGEREHAQQINGHNRAFFVCR